MRHIAKGNIRRTHYTAVTSRLDEVHIGLAFLGKFEETFSNSN